MAHASAREPTKREKEIGRVRVGFGFGQTIVKWPTMHARCLAGAVRPPPAAPFIFSFPFLRFDTLASQFVHRWHHQKA